MKRLARKEFGTQMKKFRAIAGVSQDDPAKAIGRNQSYMVSFENGDHSIGIDFMKEISAYFGVKFYDFANPDFPIPSKRELRKKHKGISKYY
ncbi:helix-turn-helix transcriptional regulator [Pedobacter sp. L105]|uniref:helix-turn-helix transcriptional regulator n=1 Tax=Pedobacter sp. L105 TaxID=1641871 RepID=UPI00131B3958|nr:helix-turn-helix transcriptional regulator [Pedobacter sp. L105]